MRKNTTQPDLGSITTSLDYIKDAQDEMKEDIKELKASVEQGYVTKTEFQEMDKRVAKIEDAIRWVSYLIIGIVITAVIGLVIVRK